MYVPSHRPSHRVLNLFYFYFIINFIFGYPFLALACASFSPPPPPPPGALVRPIGAAPRDAILISPTTTLRCGGS
ncbi:hypothetical protein NL676_012148 [Syzygium grande]|nr:hypothetical protein NL676_012148 [Syzygium grande]